MSLLDKLKKNKNVKNSIFTREDQNDMKFINTGCITLNILFSGRIDGGIALGKMSQIAAPSSLGKSFVGLKVAKNAQKRGMSVIYVDTEFAFDYEFSESVGLNNDELLVIQDNQFESVRKTVMNIFDEMEDSEKSQILLVIDSWGGLVTSKTSEDALSGKDVSDMTISKKKNSFARLMTGLGTTVFVINQTYENIMDMYNPLAIGGGKGLYFASSSIVLGSSKAKDKDGTDVVGAIVTAKTQKGRFCKENSKLKYLIKYDGGIHPYYGILDDLVEFGEVIKPTMGFYSRPCVEDDKKWREKAIWQNAAEFFKPILTKPEVKKMFEEKYTFKHSEIQDDDLDF